MTRHDDSLRILEARWAVLHAMVDKMRAENTEELERLKEQLAEKCRTYNALTRRTQPDNQRIERTCPTQS